MTAYFIRRLLLIPLTLFGITIICLLLMRVAPGGPLDRANAEAQMGGEGSARGSRENRGGLNPEQRLRIIEQYEHDQPLWLAYVRWLGVAPRETQKVRENLDDTRSATLKIPGTANQVTVQFNGKAPVVTEGTLPEGWRIRLEDREEQLKRLMRVNDQSVVRKKPEDPDPIERLKDRALLYKPEISGILQGNLGRSTRYNQPAWDMMIQRVPISLFYGLTTLILTYVICIPLGILKAIKHRTWIDNVSSTLIFAGYAIPGFVLGALLLVFFASQLRWFPIEGFVSTNFKDLSFFQKVWDVIHHAILPLICYMVGAFALLTMLVKNNLMDHLASDYMRTAVAKGASYQKAIFKHALRNALLPVIATLGQAITIFVTGSLLIERIFDIDGFGLLGFNSLMERDDPVFLAIILVSSGLMLLGNVLSDFLLSRFDPRVRFQ